MKMLPQQRGALEPRELSVEALASDFRESVRRLAQEAVSRAVEEEFLQFMEDAAAAGEADWRNGHYARVIKTTVGEITLAVPGARFQSFQTALLRPYRRNTGDLEDLIRELYRAGMTESRLADAVSERMGPRMSRETVGRIVRETMGGVIGFLNKPVPDCPVLYVDGHFQPTKRRYYGKRGSVERECACVVIGVDPDGHRRVLHFEVAPTEGAASWEGIFLGLKARGLSSPKVLISDGLTGMAEAARRVWPGVATQRDVVHVQRSIHRAARRRDAQEIADDFKLCYVQDDAKAAQSALGGFVAKRSATYPSLCRNLMAIPDLFSFYSFPEAAWGFLYTSSPVEQFNGKLRRELKCRIQLNSLDFAQRAVLAVAESYNRSCGARTVHGFLQMTEEERSRMGFSPTPLKP